MRELKLIFFNNRFTMFLFDFPRHTDEQKVEKAA